MMITMVLSLGIAVAVVALVSATVLRGTVGFLARGADNGWDNALAYVAVSGIAWALVARYATPLGLFPALLSAAALPLVQLGLLRWIYEIRSGRALAVGIVHTVIASTAITGITLMVGVVAAYLAYGRIVQDPMILVRLVLRLIGLLPE